MLPMIRCSSIGKLMATPDASELDPELVTPEVAAILAKSKRTDAEKSTLDHVRRHSLSAGAKTHIQGLVSEEVYGYEPAQIETRPILKGLAVEDECIALLSRLTGRPLTKNRQRRDNGLITGECDVFDAEARWGRDVKAPYSMATMPVLQSAAYDKDYEWQMRGYMLLWDAPIWSVDYVLVSTPEDLIGYEPKSLHYVDHIPEHHRVTSWVLHRDAELEALMLDKARAAQRYFAQCLNEFDRTHRPDTLRALISDEEFRAARACADTALAALPQA